MDVLKSVKQWRLGPFAAAVSSTYLVMVAATFAVVAVDLNFGQHEDASFSGVLPYFATAPVSLIGIQAVPDDNGLVGQTAFFVVPLVSGLLQAAGLWFALRGPRRVLQPASGGPRSS